MAEQYITNVIEIVSGVSSLRRKDGNPYEGEDHGALRHYKGVKSYDLIAHGDSEEALLAYVTDWNQLVLVAREAKLTEIASQCVAEGCDYHYESRNGRIIVRAIYKEKLERRFLDMDWSYEEPAADEEEEEEGPPEADFGLRRRIAAAKAEQDARAKAAAEARAKAELEAANAANANTNANADADTGIDIGGLDLSVFD